MKFTWGKYILISVVLILLQSLIFNHVLFSSYINPYIYIMLVIMLPFEMNKSVTLVYAFLLGMLIDIFANTAGWHMGATVFAAFSRTLLINIAKPLEGHDSDDLVAVFSLGFGNYLVYGGLIVALHHLYLFVIESFSWSLLGASIYKGLLSTVVSFVLILLVQYLFFKKRNR